MSEHEVPERLDGGPLHRLRTSTAARAAGGRWAVWVLRVVVWAILAGAALLLVRQVVAPSAAEVVDAALDTRLAGDVSEWPTDEARDAAVRAVANALALGEDDTGTAGAAAASSPAMTQTVEVVTPGRVEIHGQDHATVYLAARVLTATLVPDGDEDAGPATSRSWRWLAVPVIYDGEVVTAAEGMVEVPPPPTELPTEQRPRRELNSQLTAETHDVAAAFFAALTGESRAALDALTDGSIPLLSSDVELEEFAAWRVAEPDVASAGRPQALSAEADVVWVRPGGLVDSQTYAVDLHRKGERWQITDIGPVHAVERRD
ncbi:hypothetical protein [Nitriliruptor alkaliphilus]|uniref:hypothetical protein n=1 Tax=Nitriliruptor alkaliphilus TaxID=427918 RepID=UPI00069861FF|nr:hypothetical protein [Nitriliruptor alkaliphilus]